MDGNPKIIEEFARGLEKISGGEFERATVRALQLSVPTFQPVPTYPQGDGGLDGLSDGCSVGYCCYGLELGSGPTTTTRALRAKVRDKFKDDLLRIFELKPEGKSKLKEAPNRQLQDVFGTPPVARLQTVYLITNWFKHNGLIGDMNRWFSKYLKASNCRFVDPAAKVVIWGPDDFAARVQITQQALLHVQNPVVFQLLADIEEASDEHEHDEEASLRYDAKFDQLAQQVSPAQQAAIETVREQFRREWSKAVLLDERMSEDLPRLHEEFVRIRRKAAEDAALEVAAGRHTGAAIIQVVREAICAVSVRRTAS